ncbi:MAG: hypothetical protein IRZ16_20935 [Myxococcaceae bacterium]|nr:hypothetical protein [Myxococcaceae bacterium]
MRCHFTAVGRVVIAALFAGLAGCPAPRPGLHLVTHDPDRLAMRVGEQEVEAVVQGDRHQGRLEGAGIQLRWSGRQLQGNVLGEDISLTVTRTGFFGTRGGHTLQYSASTFGNEIVAQGRFDDHPNTLRVNGGAIVGSLGQCSVDLAATMGIYQGWKQCGDQQQSIWLGVPATLSNFSAVQTAAIVVALIGGEGHR